MTDFIINFLLLAVYGAFHSLLASQRSKNLAAGWLPALSSQNYRLIYNGIALLTMLPVGLATYIFRGTDLYTFPAEWNFAARGLQLLILLLFLMAFLQFRPLSFLGIGRSPAPEESAILQTGGMYRFVRHPLYSLGLTLLWINPTMTTGSLGLSAAITIYILIGLELEERRLLAEFGDEYRRYQRVTSRLIPLLY